MAFHDVVFPDDIAVGAVGGPGFNTTIVSTSSGIERRNINWEEAKGRWNVSFGVKTNAQMRTLIGFFRARFGNAFAFRFKDYIDFQGLSQPLRSLGSNQYQLTKVYGSGPYTYQRDITKPISGTVQVYSDGSPISTTIDHLTGIVTTTDTGTLTADFEFDVPVRFDNDRMNITTSVVNIHDWDDIVLVEVKE